MEEISKPSELYELLSNLPTGKRVRFRLAEKGLSAETLLRQVTGLLETPVNYQQINREEGVWEATKLSVSPPSI